MNTRIHCSTVQMFQGGKFLNIFQRSLLRSPRLHLFDNKYMVKKKLWYQHEYKEYISKNLAIDI